MSASFCSSFCFPPVQMAPTKTNIWWTSQPRALFKENRSRTSLNKNPFPRNQVQTIAGSVLPLS